MLKILNNKKIICSRENQSTKIAFNSHTRNCNYNMTKKESNNFEDSFVFQKQPSSGVLIKRCSENMQQI